jgi:uncharacterized membrane protein
MTALHVGACAVALVVGALVAFMGKGSHRHRVLGRVYVGATMTYAISSFFMYPSTSRLTFFHSISIQNAMLVAGGVALSRLLRIAVPAWRVWHLRFMLYSYVALVVTGLRFTLPYVLPGNRIWPAIVFVVVPICSWGWVERRVVPHWRTGSRPALRPPASRLEA